MKHNIFAVVTDTMIHRWFLTLLIVLSVAGSVAFSLIPPLLLGRIVDTLTSDNGISFSMLLLYFLSLALMCACLSFRDSILVVFGQKITHALRSTMMDHYIHLDTGTLSRMESGSVVSRFISDVDQVELLFTSGIISLFADACQMISILVILFMKTRGLFYLFAMILPFLFLYTRHVQKRMLISESENRKAVSEANSFIPESIHNILTIHNLNKESYMEEHYDTYINHGYEALNRTNFYDSIYSPVILSINALTVVAVMLLASTGNTQILALFGMSAGSAVTIINYISQIFTPIESIGMEIQTIQSAIAGVIRINDFLSLPQRTEYEPIEAQYKDNETAVDISHLSFGYDEKEILHNFSLQIRKGEHITLQGRTGAGKSTLFRLILGLYKPDQGTIHVSGIDPYRLSDSQRRHIFGYVEQKFHPVIGNIRDQITLYDSSISDEQVIQALKLTGLASTVISFPEGLDTTCQHDLFSQGQWQILSITRAIVCNPSILMLDEITADLDAEYEKEIIDTLTRVSVNRTVISISHRHNASFGRSVQIGINEE